MKSSIWVAALVGKKKAERRRGRPVIRTGHVARTTAETDIDLTLCLEGSGKTSVATGLACLITCSP